MIEQGRGLPMEPVVLIPGLLCTEVLFAPQIVALADRPILVGDHRTHDTMEANAAHILAQAPERFALAGLSMGGYIALEIMKVAPERVTRLALLDTTAEPDTQMQTENRLKLIDLAENGGFKQVGETLYPLFVHENRAADRMLKETVLEMASDTGSEAFVRQQRAIMGRDDARPGLAAISCPTLVIVGDGDRLTPVDKAREIHEGIAGSRLEIVPDCGHLSTLESPEAVTALMKSWAAGGA